MAADIAGYSRLMETDEEGTVRALRARRTELVDPLLARYDGRIANTAGDSLLLEFSSAVDAVRCAIELQREMSARNTSIPVDRQLVFRIGINVGDVISEGGDLLGDGVNVAARLEALSEPGGISLSRSTRDQIIGKLDLHLQELGETQVKNISRPVEIFRVLLDDDGAAAGAARPAVQRQRRPRWVWIAAAAIAAAVGGFVLFESTSIDFEPAVVEAMALPLPDKPSVVVLPFANLSNDPEQAVLADGITEDLITDLSKMSGLFVIGRNSSFSYRGRDVPIRQVAEELGVRYVLTGSVRRSGDTLRINAQFLDALSGEAMWAERFDGAISDIFATQDAFALKTIEALEVQLSSSEAEELRKPETNEVAAREEFQKGWELYSRFNEPDNLAAMAYFERAVELDPEYGRAYGALMLAQIRPFIFHHWGGHYTRGRELRFDLVASSLKAALKRETSLAYVGQAVLHLNYPAARTPGRGVAEDALIAAGQAIALQPNDPEAHITKAWALLVAERPTEALKFIQTAMRLDPNFPNHFVLFSAAAHFALGDLEAAAKALEDRLTRDPNAVELMPVAASILAQLGRRAEANALVQKWKLNADWESLEKTVDRYFFIVRWEGDESGLNQRLNEGLWLAALPMEATVERLAEDLVERRSDKPHKTARYLGWYGASAAAAVPALIDALSSDSRLLKKEAAIALGKIGSPAKASIPALTALADQPFIGYHAKAALELIGGD